MSMISAQCDELRKAADELQEIIDNGHNYTWHGIFTILRYAQQVLRSAAVTIWELRSKLAGVVDQSDEIDRLKEQVRWLKKGDVLHVLTDQELADHQKHEREMHASIAALMDENARLRSCLSDDAENARQIMGENAKLRELVRVMAYCAYDEHSCDRCAMNGAEMHVTVDRSLCCDGMLEKLSGLGIEADDA